MHVRVVIVTIIVSYQVAVNLDSLSAVTLLGVKLTTLATVTNIDRLNEESTLIFVMIMGLVAMVSSIPLLANHSLPGRIETEVSLSHQLFVKGRIYSTILVEILRRVTYKLDITSLSRIARLVSSLASFEKLRQNTLLLLIDVMASLVPCLDTQALSLN